MSEDVAVLAEDKCGVPGDDEVLLAVCDGETVGADDVQASVVECVDADLKGEALDEAVGKAAFHGAKLRHDS